MQVGSPVELELVGSYRFRNAQDANAVAAAVKRQLAERHERGGWYRVGPEQVRQALGNRSARQAPRAAAEARQVAASAQAEGERVRAQRARQRRRSRAQARRQKVRGLVSLLASGLTRREAAPPRPPDRHPGLSERPRRERPPVLAAAAFRLSRVLLGA
jgi:hypothetical protein